MKICKDCKQSKSLEEFYFFKGFYRTDCKECSNIRSKLNYHNRKDDYKNRQLLNRYGISYADYLKLFKEQDGVCKICGKANSGDKHLAVDHCHKTGKVRSLLCMKCNAGLGSFDENVEILEKAIAYVKDYTIATNWAYTH